MLLWWTGSISSVQLRGAHTIGVVQGVGVRQGCLLSPALFNVFLEFVMGELGTLDGTLTYCTETRNVLLWWTGVHRSGSGCWSETGMSTVSSPVQCVPGVCYGRAGDTGWNAHLQCRDDNDTTLLSAMFGKLEIVTEELEVACRRWGMKMNVAKCKVISGEARQLVIDNTQVEAEERFVFLGSVVPGTSNDVARRIALASSAFGRLRESVWRRGDMSQRLKMRLFKALIVPIAIYGAETWTLKAEDSRRLEVFEMRCLRAIRGVTLRDRLRNDDIREQLGAMPTITEVIIL